MDGLIKKDPSLLVKSVVEVGDDSVPEHQRLRLSPDEAALYRGEGRLEEAIGGLDNANIDTFGADASVVGIEQAMRFADANPIRREFGTSPDPSLLDAFNFDGALGPNDLDGALANEDDAEWGEWG